MCSTTLQEEHEQKLSANLSLFKLIFFGGRSKNLVVKRLLAWALLWSMAMFGWSLV